MLYLNATHVSHPAKEMSWFWNKPSAGGAEGTGGAQGAGGVGGPGGEDRKVWLAL